MLRSMRVFIVLSICALALAAAAAAFVYSGVYDTAATDQHTAPVYWLLKTTMRQSIRFHARRVDVPALGDASLVARGRTLFQGECARCHGAPGIAPEAFALGLRPTPANLANTGIEWLPADLYWTIKHGLKMTGMPGWGYRLPDDALWAIVAYLQVLPYESPREYRSALSLPARSTAKPPSSVEASAMPADPARGRQVIEQYACIVCHEIPGVVGASVPVGPPLQRMARRSFIAGVIPNTPDNMVRWLRAPEAFVPDGAMPNLGVTEQDARDMAAYLETLQ
jgi:mono/diheme cytochrome c family protein